MNSTSSVFRFARRLGAASSFALLVPFALAACTDAETVQQSADSTLPVSEVAVVPHAVPGEKAGAVPASVPTVALATESKGATVSKDQFRALRWIEGNWATDRNGKTPAYQTFQFASDTLITVVTYADENFAVTSEIGAMVRTNDHVFFGPATASWIVTKWDDKHIEFTPVKGAANAFTWDKVSDDTIRTTMIWSENGKEQKRTRIMERRAK